MNMPQQNGQYQQNQFYSNQNPNQMQPYYQQPMRQMLMCRMVNSEEEISPNEVPRDGSVGVFMKGDGAQIFVKFWDGNGTIRTNLFVPYVEEAKAEFTSEETLNAILATLNSIEKAITNKPNSKKVKEDSPNGYDKQFRNESNKQ